MEDALITGIAFTKDESEIMIRGVKDSPGIAALSWVLSETQISKWT